VKVTFWGTRGSLPTPGQSTATHGGNTSCVELRPGGGDAGNGVVVLDAGTGIVPLGRTLAGESRVDILLSHLHLDHILGLGFFAPLFAAGAEVHLWGPSSTTLDLQRRLTRYLSPPLFPVALRDLPCELHLHDVPLNVDVPLPSGATFRAALVCHPGPTVGYRVTDDDGRSVAYLSDHEPALGCHPFPSHKQWTSGSDLAAGVDLLIHDAQYSEAEYGERVGWGHSSLDDAVRFADLVEARRLVAFHHDPTHDDEFLRMFLLGVRLANGEAVIAARELLTIDLAADYRRSASVQNRVRAR
jgi:phosphoribosyl 1,2-cyclic phosphodiesterase